MSWFGRLIKRLFLMTKKTAAEKRSPRVWYFKTGEWATVGKTEDAKIGVIMLMPLFWQHERGTDECILHALLVQAVNID